MEYISMNLNMDGHHLIEIIKKIENVK